MNVTRILAIAVTAMLVIRVGVAESQESATDTRQSFAPDIRDDETRLKVQRGNFVAVPIPISNPTLETGLIAGAAYFYAQTEEQEKVQPASVTAMAGMYTTNDSRVLAVVQQNYWLQDSWRFTGAIGAADLRLSLLAPAENSTVSAVDWRVAGNFLLARLSRRFTGDWYGGGFVRTVDANQSLEVEGNTVDFDTADVLSVGVGLTLEFDNRDMPISTYSGHYFKAEGLFNDESFGSKDTYQSYAIDFRSYRQLSNSVVLALQFRGCQRVGTVPLWDACTIGLRGFPLTNYLGLSSYSAQAEGRWRLSTRWGLVAFAGVGEIGNSFTGLRDRTAIPSYGAGIRFSVLPAKRVNLRLDFAASRDDNAVHLSVGEAF